MTAAVDAATADAWSRQVDTDVGRSPVRNRPTMFTPTDRKGRSACDLICAIAGLLARRAARDHTLTSPADKRLGQNHIKFLRKPA
jgi:hypothetical protein